MGSTARGVGRSRWTPLQAAGERVNSGNEFLRQCTDKAFAPRLVVRLGNIIAGPAGQRFNRYAGAAVRERAAHDHRHRIIARAQLAQRRQAVHHRHLDIEHNEIGTLDPDGLERRSAVGRGSGHVKAGIGEDDSSQQTAHHGGVIHDENPNGGCSRHSSCLVKIHASTRRKHGQFFVQGFVVEGLHQIFVGSGFEGANDVVVLGLGGHHHHL